MFKKDKKEKMQETKQEDIQETPAQKKQEAKEEKMATDNKLSDLAKQIIDKDMLIAAKDKEIAEKNKIIEELNTNLQVLAQEYKTQLVLKMEDANKMIKVKMDENDAKLKQAIEENKKYGIKDQALELINIINQFEIACSYELKDEKLINYQKGFKIFLSMFQNLLNHLHIYNIQPKLGDEFDPNVMECFETVKDETKTNNSVCEVIHTGYKLYDYILKPALVKVIKNN